MLFVTLLAGTLPTVVGRMVRVRNLRLRTLHDQRRRIVRTQRAEQQSAVLAERLATVERLQPTLVAGLQELAVAAESGDDPGEVEAAARSLLARTRTEVVALTAPLEAPEATEASPAGAAVVDDLGAWRAAAEPWTVLAAGAVAMGLWLESTRVLEPAASPWAVVPACLAVGSLLALARWHPVPAAAAAWVVVAAYSRLLVPLDGSLSEAGFAMVTAFGVAALSTRRTAVLGLLVCSLGQLLGVGTDDAVGDVEVLLLCWLGGIAVGEVSRLVEQTRTNNALLAGEDEAAAARAVVEERLRLARELHDALGHSLTVVALQAGAARRIREVDPERAGEAMRTAAEAARGGVAALALDGAGCADPKELAGLLDRVRATGVQVAADLRALPLLGPREQETTFRVVQEALTNVLRHAPGSRVSIAVREAVGGVEVVVVNTAATSAGAGPGNRRGLAGIGERVAGCAGQVSWGSSLDGGFEVRALVPVAPEGPADGAALEVTAS